MKKSKIAVIAAAFFILFGVVFCGCQKESKGGDYFPLGVESYWEYNVVTYLENDITRLSKEIVQVVGKERVGEVENYKVDRFTIDGTTPSVGQYREFLAKTDKGIQCTKRAFPPLYEIKLLYPSLQTEILHSQPEERFRTNPKDGDSWKWEGIVTLVPLEDTSAKKGAQKSPKIQQVKGQMEYKYLGHEKVHIMNKDLDCIKMSVYGKSDSGQELESEIWYAPNIGRVKEEQKFYEGSKSVNHLFELVNYNITNVEPFKKK